MDGGKKSGWSNIEESTLVGMDSTSHSSQRLCSYIPKLSINNFRNIFLDGCIYLQRRKKKYLRLSYSFQSNYILDNFFSLPFIVFLFLVFTNYVYCIFCPYNILDNIFLLLKVLFRVL